VVHTVAMKLGRGSVVLDHCQREIDRMDYTSRNLLVGLEMDIGCAKGTAGGALKSGWEEVGSMMMYCRLVLLNMRLEKDLGH
jgi:hypothetical protein